MGRNLVKDHILRSHNTFFDFSSMTPGFGNVALSESMPGSGAGN
jgi:hypothetical protein